MTTKDRSDWLSRFLGCFVLATQLMFAMLVLMPIVAFIRNPGLVSLLENLAWAALGAVLFGLVVSIPPPSRESLGNVV